MLHHRHLKLFAYLPASSRAVACCLLAAVPNPTVLFRACLRPVRFVYFPFVPIASQPATHPLNSIQFNQPQKLGRS